MFSLRQQFWCLLFMINVGYTFRIFDNFQLVHKFTDPVERALNYSLAPESKCRKDILYWFQSLHHFAKVLISNCNDTDLNCIRKRQIGIDQNFFAAKQVDSFGRIPSNVLGYNNFWLGSWEECLSARSLKKPEYKTKFCYLQVGSSLITTNQYLRAYQMIDDLCRSPVMLQWSVCVPNSCTEQEVTIVFRNLYNKTNGPLRICSTKCRPTSVPSPDKPFIIVLAVILLSTLLLVGSTLLDYTIQQSSKTVKGKSLGMQCILTFSLFTNGAEVLSMKKDPERIQCLDCIRTITICWIITGNAYAYYLGGDNPITALRHATDTSNRIFLSAHIGADTFFFISGLMVSYIFFKSVVNRKQELQSTAYWTKYYIHRYLRLSPPYFMLIAFVAVIYDHLTVGPLSFERILNTEACRTEWWWNVLYMNKIYGDNGNCLPQSWYLAADFQLYLFAPTILILLHISSTAGYSVIIVVLLATAAINCGFYAKYDLPVNYVIYFADVYNNTARENYERLVYHAIWLRSTPYLVGIFTGYHLIHNQKKCFRLRTSLVTLAWLVAVLLGLTCIFGWDGAVYKVSQRHRKLKIATTAYCLRVAWASVLAWVIVACENDYAGVLKNLMELNFWRPLGRLTYCAFLTQNFLLPLIFSMERHPLHFVNVYFVFFRDVLPVIAVTFVLSFFWSCLFEIPFVKLESLTLRTTAKDGRCQLKDHHDNSRKNGMLPTRETVDPIVKNECNITADTLDTRF